MPQKTPQRDTTSTPLHELLIAEAHRIPPARMAALREIGVVSAWDLLHEIPRPAPSPPPWCETGEPPRGSAVRLRARLEQVQPLFRRGRPPGLRVLLVRADGLSLHALFFGAIWLRKLLIKGDWFLWEGRLDQAGRTLLHPGFRRLSPGEEQAPPQEEGLRMQYRERPRLTPGIWLALTDAVLLQQLPRAEDPLGLLPAPAYQALLRAAHRPSGLQEWQDAVQQLAERELHALAWRLQALTAQVSQGGQAWRCEEGAEARARLLLPWALTPAQEAAWLEIRADLRRPQPMRRLLQGEVGSGKTALAVLACLMVAEDGGQSWLLAPTAILAEQHAGLLRGLLAGSSLEVGLLTGATPALERRRLLEGLQGGSIHILVGTHALLQAGVKARRLGLIVIDEQHRFGVGQRMAALAPADGASRPDLLLLSATPIPRTLALTLYGELPVSRMQGLPPGRPGVISAAIRITSVEAVQALVAAELADGGRAFVICARRQHHDGGLDAEALHRELERFPGSGPAVLVHGGLPPAEKSEALARFTDGRARVLVATSVVEVGIDMPEATLLVVLEAERFGLAQLHQLRGRVGRGARAGRCLGHAGEGIPPRLAILLASDDGLAIAQADLTERGPGDLLGLVQAGALDLRFANLERDLELLAQAHVRVRAWRAQGRPCPPQLAALARAGGGDPAAG